MTSVNAPDGDDEKAMRNWVHAADFWKSDESDWGPIWAKLREYGFTNDEVADLLDRIRGLQSSEYGT